MMFSFSLLVSVGLLGGVLAVRRARRAAIGPCLCGFGVAIGALLPAVLLQAVLSVACLLELATNRVGRRLFAVAAIVAFCAAWAHPLVLAYRTVVSQEELQAWLPPLDYRDAAPSGLAVAEGDKNTLPLFEGMVEERRNRTREHFLADLHRSRVVRFVNSPGFGIGRGLEYSLGPASLRETRQPAFDGWSREFSYADEPALTGMHLRGATSFVRPDRLGIELADGRVSVFDSHGLRLVPEGGDWNVGRVELVGLLKHEGGAVYVSESLPNMRALDRRKTRPLDDFEREALTRLRRGETIVTRPEGGRLRMLGAIRSAGQCVGCHGGERGDLLGAFSYRLAGN